MAHSSNLISQIKLPNGTTYEVHDAQAIHSAADLGLSQALVFKGVVNTLTELHAIDVEDLAVGWVYLVKATNQEYVVVQDDENAASRRFEPLGNVHDAASSDHTHDVTASGSASLAVTASGNTTVPTVTPTTKYLGLKQVGSTGTATVLTGLGTASTSSFVTGVSTTSVSYATGASGTATAITALGTTSTATFVTGVSTTSVSYATGASGTAKAITGLGTASTTSITGISSVGAASTWSFTVSNGVLTIGGGNGTAPTAASAKTVVTGLGTPTSATFVTGVSTTSKTLATGASGTSNAITGLGTASTASFVTGVSTTSKTLATGASGTATAVTALGTASTAKVISSVPSWEPQILETQDDDNIAVITAVAVGSKNVTTNVSGTASGNVTVSGVTSQPVNPS